MKRLSKNISAWSKESQQLFDILVKDERCYTKNTKLTHELGNKYPDLVDNNFLDIGWIRKKDERIVAIRPNIRIVPIEMPPSQHLRKKYKFFKIP